MKMKIRTKLLLGFITVAVIGSLIGLVGIVNLHDVNVLDTRLYEKATTPLGYLVYISSDFQRTRVNIHKLFISSSGEEINQLMEHINELSKATDEYVEKYKTTLLDENDHLQLEALVQLKQNYFAIVNPMIALVQEGKIAEATSILNGTGTAAGIALQAQIDKLVELDIASAREMAEHNSHTADNAMIQLIAIIALGFLVSIVLAIWMGVFMVSRPLMKISTTLQGGSEQIAAASNQLASSAQMIANGATEQASSVEETSASMEELGSMVRQNLSNAREASILAAKASNVSQDGFADMNKMVESMKEIAKSSEKVGKVIKLIEDISFQTNILALNAAVEAARAGEAGMGFAVVADEVKNLANRSSEAAKDTAQMIEDSIRKTEEGALIANRLAEAFKGILSNSEKVATISKEVEASSSQQDTGINQVTQAIIQFDEVVQANASTAEESASSSEELSSQAASLMNIVQELARLVNGKLSKNEDAMNVRHVGNHSLDHASHIKGGHNQGQHEQKHSILPMLAKTDNHTSNQKKHEITPDAFIPFENDEELAST